MAFWIGMDFVMDNMLVKWAAAFFMLAVLCFVFFELGKSKAKVEIVTKEIEVIKYVEKKRAKILSAPNAGRDILLKRMREQVL